MSMSFDISLDLVPISFYVHIAQILHGLVETHGLFAPF
jgi:hypothetical protein